MANDYQLIFGNFDEEALAKSWDWLNDIEIKYFTNTSDFDRVSQRDWFEGLAARDDYYIKTMLVDNTLVGVCGIKNITDTEGEAWLYVGEKLLWGKSIGTQCLKYLISYARQIDLKSLYALILKDNTRSLNLFKKFDFIFESELEDDIVKVRLGF